MIFFIELRIHFVHLNSIRLLETQINFIEGNDLKDTTEFKERDIMWSSNFVRSNLVVPEQAHSVVFRVNL